MAVTTYGYVPVVYMLNGENTQLVEVFTLHFSLKIQEKVESWLTGYIDQYAFEEEVDFLILEDAFVMSLHMAITICSLENTTDARRVRHFLINIDRCSRLDLPLSDIDANGIELPRLLLPDLLEKSSKASVTSVSKRAAHVVNGKKTVQ